MYVVQLTNDFRNVHEVFKHDTFGDLPAHVYEQYSPLAAYRRKQSTNDV